MGFKVGDMVIYKNQTVRVLKIGGIYLTLSGFGKVNTKKEQVKLLESVQLPRIKKGYRVIVRDIHENEKTTLRCYLVGRNGQLCRQDF